MNILDLYRAYVTPLKGSDAYHTWSILSVISATLERRCWLDRGRLGILFPNTYTILVGPPAAGKSTAAGIAVDLLSQLQRMLRLPIKIGPTKITQAALYVELHDAERALMLPGRSTTKISPLFIYASELAVNMVDFGGGSLTNELIDFYDSKGHDIEMLKRTISGGAIRLQNPSITMLGCTTDSFLQMAAQAKLVNSGLASRIIFVVETGRVPKQRELIELDDMAYRSLITQLGEIYAMKGPIKLDGEANDLFVQLANKADDDCYEAKGDLYQNYYGRKPDHILKVAMALAAANKRYQIKAADIDQARYLLEAIEPSIGAAFGLRSIEKDIDLAQQLLSVIPLAPLWISKRDFHRKLHLEGKFIPTNGILEATMKTMRDSGKIKINHNGTSELYTQIVEDSPSRI